MTTTTAAAAETPKIKQFEPGKTYGTRSVCDYNCIISITVISRTPKTIVASVDGEIKKFRPSIYRGVESVNPWGSFSMAPIVRAE